MLFKIAMDSLEWLLDRTTEVGLLTPIGADPVKLWTSLYADDAVMFLRPIVEDVQNLQHLLDHFGMATGLCTNVQKSKIYPIRCDHVDIPNILGDFQVQSR
jgi:hypothetical protein